MPDAALRVLSLGAGVQSTAILLLACENPVMRFDAAIFADTGWEPRQVYDHLNRLERAAKAAGIPVYRVSSGDIRRDALDPEHRFASMPLYVLNPDGGPGMARRQCTSEYKLKPIKAKVRELLGYPCGRSRTSGSPLMRSAVPVTPMSATCAIGSRCWISAGHARTVNAT